MSSAEDRIRYTDMHDPSEMKSDALSQASFAVQKYAEEKEIAKHMKQFFDAKYSPNWHCVVGKSFANFCTYEAKHHIFFEVPPLFILLYKFG